MVQPIPIVGAQQQPTFPQVGLNIIPQGLMITIQLGPTTSINQIIDANAMDQVSKAWRESRRNIEGVFRAVQRSKNN